MKNITVREWIEKFNHGEFDNVIVVYNGANQFELGFADEYPQIKSVVWCPGTGNVGFNALELVDALFCEVNPVPVKHALNLQGWDMGPLRMPLCEMEDANLERLRNAMIQYGILEK